MIEIEQRQQEKKKQKKQMKQKKQKIGFVIFLVFVLASIGFLWGISKSLQAFTVVYDPTVAAKIAYETQKILQQYNELQRQTILLKQELAQLSGEDYRWSDVETKINELGEILGQSSQLAYQSKDLDENFQKTFPGYQASTNYPEQYQRIVQTTENTLNGILKSLGSNARDFKTESDRLRFLQQRVQNAAGQTQAIQAAAQIASEEVTQLQLLRETLIAQTNAQSVYYASTLQKEASGEASLEKILKANNTEWEETGHKIWQPGVP